MDLNTSFTNVNQNGQNLIGDVPIMFRSLDLPAMAIVAGKWQKVPETNKDYEIRGFWPNIPYCMLDPNITALPEVENLLEDWC